MAGSRATTPSPLPLRRSRREFRQARSSGPFSSYAHPGMRCRIPAPGQPCDGRRAGAIASSTGSLAAGAGGSSARRERYSRAAPDAGAADAGGSSSPLPRSSRFILNMPHSHNPLFPYRPSDAPPLDLTNTPRLENLIREGKLYISLHDAIALAIENNLDLAYFRYNFPIAQTDYQRTKAGGQVQRRQYRCRAGVYAGWLQRGRRRRRREFRVVCCRRRRHRDLDARRRNPGPLLRSLPYLQGLCRSHWSWSRPMPSRTVSSF